MVNLTHYIRFLSLRKTNFMDLSWVLQLKSGESLAFLPFFVNEKVDFDPIVPFHCGRVAKGPVIEIL